MNHQEAKLILSAFRPGGADAADPRFQEALERARRDPELAAWLARERRLDAALGGKVREGSLPPAQLKSAILAATRMVRSTPWFRRPAWITAAAALLVGLLALAAMLLPKSSDAEFARFERAMAEVLVSKEFRLDHLTPTAREAHQWLADRRVDFVMPSKLEGQPTMGCRVIEWQGHQVSLVCFKLEGGETVHLFTVAREALADAPSSEPRFSTAGRYATAGWSSGNTVFLIASSRGEPALRKVL
jgi:uncharacterized membrane protein YbaN (DUF454 family)